MYRLIYFGCGCWTDNGLFLDVERGYKDTRDCTPFYFLVDLPECSQQLVSPKQSHFTSLSLCLLGQYPLLANGHISVTPYAGVCPEGRGVSCRHLGLYLLLCSPSAPAAAVWGPPLPQVSRALMLMWTQSPTSCRERGHSPDFQVPEQLHSRLLSPGALCHLFSSL